jgi:hypothetical protein
VNTLKSTEEFFSELAQETKPKITFQTFSEKGGSSPQLTRVLHGSLFEVSDELKRLNEQGAGIFHVVNQTDLRGRKRRNILRIRAGFIDSDQGSIPSCKLQPSAIVQSVRGPHYYWFLSRADERLDLFKPMQKGLIQHYKSDPQIFDLPRTMRTPGFFHQKDVSNPKMIEIQQASSIKYDIEELLRIYPSPKVETAPVVNTWISAGREFEMFSRWARMRSAAEGSRNNNAVVICREGLARGLSYRELENIITEYCYRSGLPHAEGLQVLNRQNSQHKLSPFQKISDYRGSL